MLRVVPDAERVARILFFLALAAAAETAARRNEKAKPADDAAFEASPRVFKNRSAGETR